MKKFSELKKKTRTNFYNTILFKYDLFFILATLILIVIFNNDTVKILSLLLLLLSFRLIYVFKSNIYMSIVAITIFYFNYSIAVGEFLVGNVRANFNLRYTNYEYYIMSLIMIIIFVLILNIFCRKIKKRENYFPYKNNIIIFYLLYSLIILINIFFFDRSYSETYIVRGNSIQGYSFLLFIFLIYYSGNLRNRKIMILILVFLVSIQSMIFGGRGSIVPILILIMCTIFIDLLNFKRILLLIMVGIMLMTLVGSYRHSNSLDLVSVYTEFKELLFVQDTSVMAFTASTTHLGAADYFETSQRVHSLIDFILSIFIGGSSEIVAMGNVSKVAESIYPNIGGGIFVTHFYFWLGWIGVILSGVIVSWVLNRGMNSNKNLGKLIFTSIIINIANWYLYGPLQLFRGGIFIVIIMYITLNQIDIITKKAFK